MPQVSRSSISRLVCTAAALLGLTLVRGLEAQHCTRPACRATNVVSIRVGAILRLSLEGSTTVVATPGAATLSAGYQEAAGPTATVRSNGRWKLQVSGASDVWTAADSTARRDKPASDLEWTTSGSEYRSVSTDPVVAAAGTGTNGTSVPFRYRTRFQPQADTPGTYSLVVRYTLTAS